MRLTRSCFLISGLLPFLFPFLVFAQIPIPAPIGGTLTVDGGQITQATDDGFAISVTQTDGAPFDPPARDDDGLNDFDFYLINIPIFDAQEQPGGARPGDAALLRVTRDGVPLTVTAPPNGEIVVGESGSQTQEINIVAATGGGDANQPPDADAGADRRVAPGQSVTLDPSGSSDPDAGDALSFAWEQIDGTAVSLADAGAGRRTFSAPSPAGTAETLVFRLTVTDAGGLSDADTVDVTVQAAQNQAPVADAGPDQQVAAGSRVVLDGGNSTDPDSATNGIADFDWRQLAGTSASLIPTGTPGRVEFTAPTPPSGGEALLFELTVTDGDGLTGSDQATVNVVSAGNQAPMADAGPDQMVSGGEVVTLDGGNSVDPDPGDAIAGYEWRQLSGPAVLLADDDTLRPRFTAPAEGAALTFELRVTDSRGLQATDEVTVNVIAGGNQPPVADAGPDQQASEGARVALDASNSTDPEGDIGLFLWSQLDGPAVVLDDAKAARPEFTAPAVGPTGAVLVFELTVVDGGLLEATDRTRVAVLSVSRPPIADAGVNQTVLPGELVVLDGGGSRDADGEIVSYQWRQIEGPGVSISTAGRQTASFVAPAPAAAGATLRFELRVADDDGLADLDEVMVRVSAGPPPPTADAGPDVQVREGDVTALNGTRSRAAEGTLTAYRWRQVAGPGVTLSNPAEPVPTFAVPRVGESGASMVFELIVTDSNGLQDADEVRYAIEDAGDGPGDESGGCFLDALSGDSAGWGF
jgi:hypothetical protein